MKTFDTKKAMSSAIAKAHRSAIKSYEKSGASFLRQAEQLRGDHGAKTDKMIRSLEKLAAACREKAADHQRKIEKRAPEHPEE